MKKTLFILSFISILKICVFSQDATGGAAGTATITDNEQQNGVAVNTTRNSNTSLAELPRIYRKLTLGMSIDDLKTALKDDNEFLFRGDKDVSFLPVSEQNLVDSAGRTFIKRAFFQIKDNQVFIMSFTLNTDKIDHYSVFTSFVQKYGEPLSLDPKIAMWENGDTRIFIERPLTIKYIDRKIYDTILADSKAGKAQTDLLRQEFLDDF
ncbi:MAG: hypothetical protein Ta2B_06220 [Termitinemataceae bacterium]|nr:MAG: hypothetical protein Ta2B_06220 [Termitinemataceae bacterium]